MHQLHRGVAPAAADTVPRDNIVPRHAANLILLITLLPADKAGTVAWSPMDV